MTLSSQQSSSLLQRFTFTVSAVRSNDKQKKVYSSYLHTAMKNHAIAVIAGLFVSAVPGLADTVGTEDFTESALIDFEDDDLPMANR
jgi:hypothetical protein